MLRSPPPMKENKKYNLYLHDHSIYILLYVRFTYNNKYTEIKKGLGEPLTYEPILANLQ